jgi:hypothetical protein
MSITPLAPEIPDTQSPYWLRLYGHWIHLNGIRPGVDVAQARGFSELITVDGYRYSQRAPRGPRTWVLDYEHGTAAATAALESAAYNYPLVDPLGADLSLMFLDTNAAKVNMVDIDTDTTWKPFFTPAAINVGESPDQPIWKPSYGVDGDKTIYLPVRAGVTYSVAFWTALTAARAAAVIANLVRGVGTTLMTSYNYPGPVSGADNPVLSHFTFTPAFDGTAAITFEWEVLRNSAGLMVYEGDCEPDYYRNGRRTPCQVSVQDPALSTNLIWPKECDLCALPREHATFTVQEVGIGMLDALRGTT